MLEMLVVRFWRLRWSDNGDFGGPMLVYIGVRFWLSVGINVWIMFYELLVSVLGSIVGKCWVQFGPFWEQLLIHVVIIIYNVLKSNVRN